MRSGREYRKRGKGGERASINKTWKRGTGESKDRNKG